MRPAKKSRRWGWKRITLPVVLLIPVVGFGIRWFDKPEPPANRANIELVRGLGADHVIDYKQEDFTQGEARYDLIVDNVGIHALSDMRRVLKPQGILAELPEAIRYLEEGRARGKIIVDVAATEP